MPLRSQLPSAVSWEGQTCVEVFNLIGAVRGVSPLIELVGPFDQQSKALCADSYSNPKAICPAPPESVSRAEGSGFRVEE